MDRGVSAESGAEEMSRARNVLRYYDDAELVLAIVPNFPEHRRDEIPSLANFIRRWGEAANWLLLGAKFGFRFKVRTQQ